MSILKTIYLQHLNGSSPNATLDANGNMTVTGTVVSSSPTGGMRNKIINGDMRIDQRNAGASVTASTTSYPWPYTVDRWNYTASQASKFTVQQNAGSVTPPVGFNNYLGVTSSSAYTVGINENFCIQHRVEGYNIADLGWGTTNAKTVTVSFWVRSSLTGTFAFSFDNAYDNRTYVAPYTINSANTWEYKTITIPGDTTGTWLTTNGVGVCATFSLGTGTNLLTSSGTWNSGLYLGSTGQVNLVGTSGATFYITGVQLEQGTIATPFERRLYGAELALCQRYFQTNYLPGTAVGSAPGNNQGQLYWYPDSTTNYASVSGLLPVVMRAAGTGNLYSPNTGAVGKIRNQDLGTDLAAAVNGAGPSSFHFTVYGVSVGGSATLGVFYTISSEL